MKNNNSIEKSEWGFFSVVVSIIIILWIINFLFAMPIPMLPSDKGVFGDSFGPLNVLFSGLAFAGIIISIKLQSKELHLQREELKLQRITQEEQTREIQKQREEITAQRTLSEEHQNERFFLLLFEQFIKSKRINDLQLVMNSLYDKLSYGTSTDCYNELITLVNFHGDYEYKPYLLDEAIEGIMQSTHSQFLSRFIQLYEFTNALNTNIGSKYLNIVENELNYIEKIYIYIYYTAKYKTTVNNLRLIKNFAIEYNAHSYSFKATS